MLEEGLDTLTCMVDFIFPYILCSSMIVPAITISQAISVRLRSIGYLLFCYFRLPGQLNAFTDNDNSQLQL